MRWMGVLMAYHKNKVLGRKVRKTGNPKVGMESPNMADNLYNFIKRFKNDHIMPSYKQMLYDIEVHSVEGIGRYFEEGGNPNEVHDGIPLFTTMVEIYTRTPRFKDCVKA